MKKIIFLDIDGILNTKYWYTQMVQNDDMDYILPEQQSHFVQTNPEVGITEEDAKKVIMILNKEI